MNDVGFPLLAAIAEILYRVGSQGVHSISHTGSSIFGGKKSPSELQKIFSKITDKDLNLVSKCSVTPARIAATPLGARQGFGGPNYPRQPKGGGGPGWGATGPLGGWGCSCDTPATPSKLQKRAATEV